MLLEFQLLAWDRHKNEAGLNQLTISINTIIYKNFFL
jgi:hypothetical protein